MPEFREVTPETRLQDVERKLLVLQKKVKALEKSYEDLRSDFDLIGFQKQITSLSERQLESDRYFAIANIHSFIFRLEIWLAIRYGRDSKIWHTTIEYARRSGITAEAKIEESKDPIKVADDMEQSLTKYFKRHRIEGFLED